jgi:hypothetical protein
VRVGHRGHHPPGHGRCLHRQLGMHAGHNDVEPLEQLRLLVERAVLEDVNLYPGQYPHRGNRLP